MILLVIFGALLFVIGLFVTIVSDSEEVGAVVTGGLVSLAGVVLFFVGLAGVA